MVAKYRPGKTRCRLLTVTLLPLLLATQDTPTAP
jgi:hypothetical protein